MPSRVIHIRKLPSYITETEVISLGLPFGDVTNLLMLKAKNQVLLSPATRALLACSRALTPRFCPVRPSWR